MLCLTRIEVLSNIWTLRLFSTNHNDSLNFDQHTRAGEAGNGDEGTGRKIVFRKHLTPNLYKAVAVADIGDEYRHGHMLSRLPPARCNVRLIAANVARTCASKSPASDFPEASSSPAWPASQTVLPPSVITAGENARSFCRAVSSRYCAACAAAASSTLKAKIAVTQHDAERDFINPSFPLPLHAYHKRSVTRK